MEKPYREDIESRISNRLLDREFAVVVVNDRADLGFDLASGDDADRADCHPQNEQNNSKLDRVTPSYHSRNESPQYTSHVP